MWDISCAGHLCAGDTPLDAAVRECYEELGIIVNPSDLTFLFTVFQSYHSPDGLTRDNEFSSVYLFKPVSTLHFNISREEIDDIKYVTVPVLQGMVYNADPDLVPHAEEYPRLFEEITAYNS
jgi:8-oxo-dGTP pyrophosphatase MutT (NUDIX family)